MSGDDINPALQSSTGEGGGPAAPPADDKARAEPRGGKGKSAVLKSTQAEPTAPRAIDAETGLELDEHGLPTSGPARRQWLADAGVEDPALKAAEATENNDG